MDIGSRMPNCLRTAMNSSTTTAIAHSSMPWMPMAAGLPGAGACPSPARCLGRRRAVQPARPLGEAAAHMPPAGGAAAVGGPGARRRVAAASWAGPERDAAPRPSSSATFRVSPQTSRRGDEERSSGGRLGPEAPPCPARAQRLFRPLSSPAGAGARGRSGGGGPRRSRPPQPPSQLPVRSLA